MSSHCPFWQQSYRGLVSIESFVALYRLLSTFKMGGTFSKIFARLFSKKEMRILMVERTRLFICSPVYAPGRSGRRG